MDCPKCHLINPESALRCDCGYDFKGGTVKQSYIPKTPQAEKPMPAPVTCPKCGSGQVQAIKKGFGLGKAVGGAIIAGPVGLLGDFLGSGKIEV